MADKEYDERIESEARLGMHVTNDMLTCQDCLFKDVNDKSGVCDVYEDVKPMEVLNGGNCSVKVVE